MASTNKSTFPIPSSLQDLEREPYNLLPYPAGFADDDEAARADSFDGLVTHLERGNRTLASGGMTLFEEAEEEQDGTCSDEGAFDPWMDEERVQAMYTLVRKSSSLAPSTRKRLISATCQAVQSLSTILGSSDTESSSEDQIEPTTNTGTQSSSATAVVSQSFRDALACHLYMLFSIMHFTESESKSSKALNVGTTTTGGGGGGRGKKISAKEQERRAEAAELATSRETCARAMLVAAQAMSGHTNRLWKRGVPDEDVVNLPCRIAYQMLEGATGVVARRACSGTEALGMIAATVNSADSLLSTVVAALVDLLCSYEHMAPLVAELCCMVNERPTNRLATELLREIGRMDMSGPAVEGTAAAGAGGKASGVRNVAPFLSELASRRPRLVLAQISLVLPHLDSEPYQLRSAIVATIGNILTKVGQADDEDGNSWDVDASSPSSEEDKEDESHDGNEGGRGTSSDADSHHMSNISKGRSALLDILTERVRDSSSFTRVAVLKAWATVVESDCLPLERFLPVTSLAISRLQDKTVMVRRSAMQLLTLILENNPYMGCLDPVPYMDKVKELEVYLKANMPSDIEDARAASQKELEESKGDEISKDEIESAALAAAIAEAEEESNSDNLSESQLEYLAKVKALKFASSALNFIALFEDANTAFEGMLLSSNASDVTEALRFFVRARHFQLPSAVTGMKQALSLIWSSETGIQDEVLKAFVEVFISVSGTEGKELLPHTEIADNLLFLAGQATVSEKASIEEAIARLVKENRIPSEVFMLLWSIASGAPGETRAAAILVLSMGATADPTIIDSATRLRLLLDVGLGDAVEENRDWTTIRSAAAALQRIQRAKHDPSSARYLVLEHITERLCSVAQGDWCNDANTQDTCAWFSAAEQSIDAIFAICPWPERAAADIIRVMESTTFGVGLGEAQSSCHSLRLSRFFFTMGHIALKLLVYAENLGGSVRRANAAKTLAKQESVDNAKSQKKPGASRDESGEESEEDDAIEAELGLAQEAEAENEKRVLEISEQEIVCNGLIGAFAPLLVRIVGNEGGAFTSEILTQASTLTLCKFMCISRTFCEKHLPLLLTALARAPTQDTTLRANTVVALGDLAFRFPNEVEPYTPRLYACLRDPSTRVRRHTLMVLTHLILNDMVKVKGQVCEIALCLQDEESRIQDMARLLFFELSKRSNNPIYNLLPDIVSQLSEIGIRREEFRSIMSFLLGFITKERQIETLCDKLCQRFPKAKTISQKADLAYCLAQLKINEKCVKSLNDHYKLYSASLFDEDVYKSFTTIVSKAKKASKSPESKQFVADWEARLEEAGQIGAENEAADAKALQAKRRAARRKQKQKTKGKQPAVGKKRSTRSSRAAAALEDAENMENSLLSVQ